MPIAYDDLNEVVVAQVVETACYGTEGQVQVSLNTLDDLRQPLR